MTSRFRQLLLAGLPLLVAGCSDGLQSVMNPQGSQADQIARLAWLLFGAGTGVLVIVAGCVLFALWGSDRIRRILAQRRTIVILGIAFPAIALSVLLAYGLSLMRPLQDDGRQKPLRIEVVGEQWWWRVRYADDGEGAVDSANEIRIPVGIPIELTLKSTDVIHSFWVPNLAGKVDMIPGRPTHLRLRANAAGIYRGQCAEYCGGAHALMAMQVFAMPEAEFRAWLRREASVGRAPREEAEIQGEAVFSGAGCGACHAIRGTTASGNIGPDLTHVGSRQSLGANTLALTHANLVRFIVNGQDVKPGNRMPEFRIFSSDEVRALADYLMSLK